MHAADDNIVCGGEPRPSTELPEASAKQKQPSSCCSPKGSPRPVWQGTRDTSASVRRNFGRCTLTKPHWTRQRYSLCPCETSNSPMCICANTVDVQARTCLRSDMCTTHCLEHKPRHGTVLQIFLSDDCSGCFYLGCLAHWPIPSCSDLLCCSTGPPVVIRRHSVHARQKERQP